MAAPFDMGDIYFLRKNSGPSVEKDRIRSSLAEYCLSHWKTHAAIMKSDFAQCTSGPRKEDDLDANIFYSLNKKRRWEVEESIGAKLLKDLNESNSGWMVAVFERVTSKSYSWQSYFYGPCADNFELFHPIKRIHYLNDNKEYNLKCVNSVLGQTYHNFMGCQEFVEDQEESPKSVVSYHILRAPANYLVFLKKSYQYSNYWGHNWPRAGYWNRLNRGKDRIEDLRYDDFEDSDVDFDDKEEDFEDRSDSKLKLIENFKKQLESEKFLPTLYDKEYDNYINELKQVLLGFDWKQHQHFLNTFKQYRTEIEGLKIHFLRVSTPPKEKKSRMVPLLIVHGFPGSFWDFFKIIPILTNPSRHGFDFGVEESIQFDVIVPSLPGFLFSDKPQKQGFDAIATARILAKLMYRLDLNDYFVHGAEGYGTDVATLLASLYPTRISGLHVSNPFVRPTFSTFTLAKYAWKAMKNEEEAEDSEIVSFTDMADYFKQDKFTYPTNSQALGAAFANSPTGTAKYIESRWKQVSTFSADINLNELFTLDEISTEIYLYWLTDTLPSALTILDNSYNYETVWLSSQVRIPTAVSYTKQSPWRCSKDVLEDRYLNLTRVNDLPKGGMFHHLQDGHKIAEDIFSFVELQLIQKK